MTVSIDGSIPVIMFFLFGTMAGVLISAFPLILLGMKLQRRKDPKDRVKVGAERQARKQAESRADGLESEVLFLHNVSHEFVRQINSFMRRMKIEPKQKEVEE